MDQTRHVSLGVQTGDWTDAQASITATALRQKDQTVRKEKDIVPDKAIHKSTRLSLSVSAGPV